MQLVLHAQPCPRAYLALITAKYSGIDIDHRKGQPPSTALSARHPLGLPVLLTPDGALWESCAIARYIARVGHSDLLYGRSAFQLAQIDAWLDFAAHHIDLPRDALLVAIPDVRIASLASAKARVHLRRDLLAALEPHLLHHTFIVGERVSLADIVVSMALYPLYTVAQGAELLSVLHNTTRWFCTCVHQSQFRAVLGDIALFAAPASPVAAPKQVMSRRKPAAWFTLPPQEKKKWEEAEEEEEEEEAHKLPNPLEQLAPSPFSLADWKRVYAQTDTLSEAMPWFWQHYDPAGYSLWRADYMYNHELDRVFKAHVPGWLQRVEQLRNHAFGVVLMHGVEEPTPALTLSAVWLFRGRDVPAAMQDTDDALYYTWVRLDEGEAAHRAMVSEYFAWTSEFGGRGPPVAKWNFK